jgi:hypothetical protein
MRARQLQYPTMSTSNNIEEVIGKLEGALSFCTAIADLNDLSIAVELCDRLHVTRSISQTLPASGKWCRVDTGAVFDTYEEGARALFLHSHSRPEWSSIAIALPPRDSSKWYSDDGLAFDSKGDRDAYHNKPGVLERMYVTLLIIFGEADIKPSSRWETPNVWLRVRRLET